MVAVLGVAAAACGGPTTPHWTGDGVHIVDGYWMQREQACEAAPGGCDAAVLAAERSLGVDPATVVRQATAGVPGSYLESDGRAMVMVTSGWSMFVILDLKDGTRRVAGYGCFGVPDPPPSGTDNCGVASMGAYQVGHEPTIPAGP